MTLEEVEAVLGRGQEIPADQVPQYGVARAVDGKLTKRVVEGERFFRWRVDDHDETFFISFQANRVLEKHHSFVPLF
jgi:hypothetical protein